MKVPEPRKLSSGNYFIQLRLDGVSVPVTAPTAKECKDTAAYVKAQHRAGKRPKKANNADKTLTQAIDDYIAARSNTLSLLTIRGYRTIQKNRFQSVMNKKLKDINDWKTICNDEAKLCAPKTLKNSYHFITSVLAENGVETEKVKLPQIVEKETKWLEPEQVLKFIEAVKGKKCEIPALLALSSLRRSEIYALSWDDIDLENRMIKVSGAMVLDEDNNVVQQDTNKNTSSQRDVPIMIDSLYDALNACKNKQGNLMSGHPNTLYAQINRVCKASELPEVGVHGLRHSFASLAYHLGVSEKTAMLIGGWSDYETMRKIYTHIAKRDVLKAEQDLTAFFKNANKNANEKIKASIINAYSVD